MMRIKSIAAGSAILLALAGCAGMGGNVPAKFTDGVLTGSTGMTLYMFDKDAGGSGKSVCVGPCAKNWLPFAAGPDANASGDWTVITRDDGTKQWAYKGKPLHYWVKDQKPGDRTGDGFANNSWHVIKPEAARSGY